MTNNENEIEPIDLDKAEAGDLVKSWCGKCGEFRVHTVKAKTLVLGKPPKSICKTCGALHLVRFKRPGTRRTRKSAALDPALSWANVVEAAEVDEWIPYQISTTFSKGDFIEHRKYGKGKVLRVLGKYKVQILFQVETKTMLQNK